MAGLALSSVGHELLDDPVADPAAVAESLRNIARANRWFGGTAAVRFGLSRLLAGQRRGSTFTLLDVGTGLGDLPVAAARWAERRGLRIVPVGVERNRTAATLANQRGVPAALACAGMLPVRERGVDIVLVSQVAHHLAPASVVELARTCTRAARVGVLFSDLRRSGAAALGFRLGARVLGFDAATRADGVTSIQRGYRADELARLLATAGVSATIHRRPGSRLVAVWRTS